MTKSIIEWFIWIFGTFSLFLIDYFIRINDGNIRTGGINENLLSALIYSVGLVSVWFLYMGVRKKAIWFKIIVITTQVVIGYFLFIWVLLYYVCTVGIDCI